MCSEHKILNSNPHAEMFQGSPPGPWAPLLNRKTMAELTMLPSQDRNPSELSHGPIESALQGMGRWLLTAIFIASDRSSTQLLTKNETGVSGQTTEKSERYPENS